MLQTPKPYAAKATFDIANVAVPASLLSNPDRFGGRLHSGCHVGTLHVVEGAIAGMTGCDAAAKRVVTLKLTEPHAHFDKCHTIERLGDVGGDLSSAAAAQYADKELWTAEDLRGRMRRALGELARAGVGTVRTHIDWGDDIEKTPLAWEIACELRAEARDLGIDLQVAALVDIDALAQAAATTTLAKRIAQDDGVLGTFVLHHQRRREGLAKCFALADRYGLPLDFHVDEGLDAGLDGLDLIEDTARDTGFEGPVLCGHACSLTTQPADAVRALGTRLAKTGIAIVCLPSTNLYLQGRNGGTPKSRGLTMIHELQTCGVNVSLGSDNVRDAFCPVGQHNPLYSMSLAVLAAHLDPPLARHFPMISTLPLAALGQAPRYVDTAHIGDLLQFDVPDVSTLLADLSRPRPLITYTPGDIVYG